MNLSLRRALAAAVATTTLLALAGCGDDSDKKASDEPGTASSATGDTSEDAGDSGSGEAQTEGQELSGPEFADLLKGALDQATTAHVTMDLGASLGSGEGDADYTKSPPEMAVKLSMDALGGDVEVRLVDGTMYMKSATFGDKWVSASLDDPDSPLAPLGSTLDLTKQLQTFADAVTSATFEGPDDVDGETFDHYTATVDTQKLLQSLPSAGAGQADLPDSMTQEWWLDDDGLIRQFSSDFAGATTVLTLSEWGEDVDIEAPPSDEVTAMPGATG